jgi:hypothetical protein
MRQLGLRVDFLDAETPAIPSDACLIWCLRWFEGSEMEVMVQDEKERAYWSVKKGVLVRIFVGLYRGFDVVGDRERAYCAKPIWVESRTVQRSTLPRALWLVRNAVRLISEHLTSGSLISEHRSWGVCRTQLSLSHVIASPLDKELAALT